MPRFFLPALDPVQPVITGEDAHHIGFSLRMRPGEQLTVCAGGVDYDCRIREITGDCVYFRGTGAGTLRRRAYGGADPVPGAAQDR